MKRKEREHLKEDPFMHFIEIVFGKLRDFKKEIIIGVTAVIIVIIALVVIGFVKSGSVSTENKLFSEALAIKNDAKLTVDQKIENLLKIESKGGLSSATKLFLAGLYFEKGDIAKADETLKAFPSTGSKLIKDQKRLMEAEILAASKKHKEALELLNKLFNDPDSEVGKDYVLFKMAKMQVDSNQKETAITNLKKLTEDYPRSMYSYEARTLLSQIDKK